MESVDIDFGQLRVYVLEKFQKEGDFAFLKAEELTAMVDAMMELDQAYIQSVGEGIYDDDAAYEAIFAQMQLKFPAHKMYCMRLTEDYLDFAEEYLVSINAIDWE